MSAAAPALSQLWVTRCPVPTATSIALDQGWLTDAFAADGIEVATLQDARGAERRESHFTHDLPGLIREGGNVPALWTRSRGTPTRLIGLTWIDEYQALLTRPDSGITGPEKLAGRRLALPVRPGQIDFWRAMALRGSLAALRLGDVRDTDVTFVDVPGPRESPRLPDGRVDHYAAELDALAAGRVDAIYVKGAPGVEAAQRSGAVAVVELGAHPDPAVRINNGTPRPITVDQRLLDDHPDVVVRFLAVLTRTAGWAADRPDEVAAIVASETRAGAAGVGGAYADLHRRLDVSLASDRLEALRDQKDFLLAHGFLEADFDLDAWADPAPLRAAHDHLSTEGSR